MIHGQRNGFGWIGKLHRLADWVVPDGTPIELKP